MVRIKCSKCGHSGVVSGAVKRVKCSGCGVILILKRPDDNPMYPAPKPRVGSYKTNQPFMQGSYLVRRMLDNTGMTMREEDALLVIQKHPEGIAATEVGKLMGIRRRKASDYCNSLAKKGSIARRKKTQSSGSWTWVYYPKAKED